MFSLIAMRSNEARMSPLVVSGSTRGSLAIHSLLGADIVQRLFTSRMGLEPSHSRAACLTRSKKGPLPPEMSEISITVPGCASVSK
jgi:hypothetical protein